MKREEFDNVAKDTQLVDRLIRALENGDEKETERYSPTGLMFKNRIIIVAGEVNQQLMINIVAQLKHLETADAKEPITMLINSPGGSVIDGMAIFDIMREISCPINTVGCGMQASMGSILLAGGDNRRMTQNSELMIHQIMGGASGGTQHTDFEIRNAHMKKLHEELKSVYVEFTGLNHKFWDTVMERDTWLSAEQAHKMGFIHTVVGNAKPRGPYAAEAKRDTSKGGRKDDLEKIATMSKREVLDALSSGQADEGKWGGYRPELVVRLSEFPEFWTKQLAAERKNAQTASAAVANDDKPAAERKPRAKKVNGPSAS